MMSREKYAVVVQYKAVICHWAGQIEENMRKPSEKTEVRNKANRGKE
jgi:hypothetical protein